VLTSMSHSVEVCVSSWACPCGNSVVPYDGYDDGVFNQTNQSLWTHDCLIDFWNFVHRAGLTFHAFAKQMADNHEKARCAERLPSKTVVIKALWSFLDLLDIDYDAGGCPMCDNLEHERQVLIGDGVSVGNRADLALPSPTPPDLPPTVVPEL
jgi:hypothetical protein